jgi:Ca2+-binding EF-hand superfamily protein
VWQFDTDDKTDIVFIRDFATPYFSSVYQSLVNQGSGGILEVARVKSYFNLPEIIFSRLIGIMNENGDDRIDHEEWLQFFLRLTCSSPKQRIYLVFQIFDIQNS